jgi:hypothetical protein
MSQNAKHHLRLLLEVRWQIFRNSLRVKGQKLELAAQIVTAVLGSVIGLGLGLTQGAAAYLLLLKGKTFIVPLLLEFIFFGWLLGPVLLEGSSPALNFREIARYPVSFRLYYALYAAYGLLDPWALLCLLWLGCIWLGIAVARPAWAIPAAFWLLAFAAVNLLFNRVLFGFLERVMSTRRGRERILAVGLLFFLLGNVGLYMVLPRLRKSLLHTSGEALVSIHQALPPGLVSRGIQAESWVDITIALAGLMGYAGAAAGFLRRQLWGNYRGELFSETPAKRWTVQMQPGWRLPFLDDASSAIFEKELRYALRNPLYLINSVVAPLLALIVASTSTIHDEALRKVFERAIFVNPAFAYPMLAGCVLLALGSQAYSCFSFDSRGFYCWLMSPIDLRRVILAKNLALGCLLALSFAAVTLLLSLARIPSLWQVVMVTAGLTFAALAMIGAGNLFSVWYPTAIEYGRISAKKVSHRALLLSVPIQAGIGGSLVLVFYGAHRWHLDWLPLVAFPLLLLVALRFYLFSLQAASKYAGLHSEEIAAQLI